MEQVLAFSMPLQTKYDVRYIYLTAVDTIAILTNCHVRHNVIEVECSGHKDTVGTRVAHGRYGHRQP
jgi:hypothetical protein